MLKLETSTESDPDPLKDPKMEPPKATPITTAGKLGDYREVPFFGSFRGSGKVGILNRLLDSKFLNP